MAKRKPYIVHFIENKKKRRRLYFILGLITIILLSFYITNKISEAYSFPSISYKYISFFIIALALFLPLHIILFNDAEHNRFLAILLVNLLMVLVLLGQLHVFSIQVNIFAKQTEILEKSSPSWRPYIDLNMQSKTVPTFSSKQIDGIRNDGTAIENFELQIINIGEMDSGPVQIWLRNEWAFEDTLYFPEIISKESAYDRMELITKECKLYPDVGAGCDLKSVPLGEQTLKFEIFCSKCKPQYYYQELIICIWENFTKDCDKFRKR